MQVELGQDWSNLIKEEFEKDYFSELKEKVELSYSDDIVFPPKEEIFSAFKLCSFEKIKVVIIGQDPYHGLGQANGLCFSVSDGIGIPPSLKNILKEIEGDLGFGIPSSGNLTSWASQGVLLLNSTLTVKEGKAGSHQKLGWEIFTNAIIKRISEEKEGIVFMLWGGFAKGKAKFIDEDKHLVLTSGHPSPLSANRGYWFGNKHFSQVNTFLLKNKKVPIDWSLID